MNSKDVTVIIPIHDVTKDFGVWFDKSILSVEQSRIKPGKLLLVCSDTTTIKEYMSGWDKKPSDVDVSIVYNSDKTSYCGNINFGVNLCDTKWFSILEYDDEYSNIWFKQFDEYSSYYEDVDLFLPLVVDTDEKGQFIGFTNEALWAIGFSEDLGRLDNNTLLRYQNFQVSGMIMKKESFTNVGGMKDTIKLTFNYEFLLRATYNDVAIMTIPKVGYKHTNQRVNSLFWEYKFKENSILSNDEAKFWMDVAKKEYFFTSDRAIEYIEK